MGTDHSGQPPFLHRLLPIFVKKNIIFVAFIGSMTIDYVH